MSSFRRGNPYAPFPFIFGHETSAEIVKLSTPTDQFKLGDKGVYEITLGCGKCAACREGRYNCCANIKIISGKLQGAFAEYVKVPYFKLHKVPDDMSYENMAICEPYTVSAQAAERAKIGPNDTVMIMGAGTIALTLLDNAKARGAKTVIVAARKESQRQTALKFGADYVVDLSQDIEAVTKQVMEMTKGDGCQVVADATASKAVIESTVKFVAVGGRILLIGACPENVSFPGNLFITKELPLVGTRNSKGQLGTVVDRVYTGKYHSDEFISRVFPYTVAQAAFEYAADKSSGCIKALIKFAD